MTVYMTREQAEFLKRDIEASMPGYFAFIGSYQPERQAEKAYNVGIYPGELSADIVVSFTEMNDWNLFKNAALCFAKHAEMEVEEGKLEEQAKSEQWDEFVNSLDHSRDNDPLDEETHPELAMILRIAQEKEDA